MGRWGGKHIRLRVVAKSTGSGVSWTRVQVWLCHCQPCDLEPQFPNLLNGQNNHTHFPGQGNGRWYRQEWKWVSEGMGRGGEMWTWESGLPLLLLRVGFLQIRRRPPHCPFSPFPLPKDT